MSQFNSQKQLVLSLLCLITKGNQQNALIENTQTNKQTTFHSAGPLICGPCTQQEVVQVSKALKAKQVDFQIDETEV